MPLEMDIVTPVRTFVVDNFLFGRNEGLTDNESFLDSGIIDSTGILQLIAFLEELVWDRAVWHDRSWLFGEPWNVGALKLVIVPLLALPQLTHYVLDGFIWRRRSNPSVAELVTFRP